LFLLYKPYYISLIAWFLFRRHFWYMRSFRLHWHSATWFFRFTRFTRFHS